jgi:hypothetical protein
MVLGALDNPPQIRQPRLARHQGGTRFEAHVAAVQVGIALIYIGRITEDQIKASLNRLPPVALQNLKVIYVVFYPVALCQGHGLRQQVGCQNLGLWQFCGQRQTYCPGASA